MTRETLPGGMLSLWASTNGIAFDGVEILDQGRNSSTGRGYAVIAQRDFLEGYTGPLMTVPRHLILSTGMVQAQAEKDDALKELLAAASDLAEVEPTTGTRLRRSLLRRSLDISRRHSAVSPAAAHDDRPRLSGVEWNTWSMGRVGVHLAP